MLSNRIGGPDELPDVIEQIDENMQESVVALVKATTPQADDVLANGSEPRPTAWDLAQWVNGSTCPTQAKQEMSDRISELMGLRLSLPFTMVGGLILICDRAISFQELHDEFTRAVDEGKEVSWPLAPLVAAWQNPVRVVQPNSRAKGRIIPSRLGMAHGADNRMDRLHFRLAAHTTPDPDGEQYVMPGFGRGDGCPASTIIAESHCLTQNVTQRKWLPHIICYRKYGGSHVSGGISKMAKQELLDTIRDRYRSSTKKDKSRILDEFIAVTGHHRKHGIRMLGKLDDHTDTTHSVRGRRIYDEAVREAVIVIWEAADRICGKRLKAALPHLADSMECHGHLALDPEVRDRLLAASAATLDRLLKPIRPAAGSRRRRRRRQLMGKSIPLRTYNDWNRPPPGFLEIDLVLHCGGPLSGSFIHSLVATDICTGWAEAVPLLAKEQSLIVEGLEAIGQRLPFRIPGIDSDNDSAFINETLIKYCVDRGLEFTRSRAYRSNDQAWIKQKNGSVVRRFVGHDRY